MKVTTIKAYEIKSALVQKLIHDYLASAGYIYSEREMVHIEANGLNGNAGVIIVKYIIDETEA